MLLDEVFLDVIENKVGFLFVIDIVKDIKKCICKELGLIVLVGVFYNKFLVKIVLDYCKFDGLCIIYFD